MKISLVTTLFNEAFSVDAFLGSFKNFSLLPDEIIIVDGGSTDGTIEKINKFIAKRGVPCKIKLIVDESCNLKRSKSPIAKGRNIAIENAENEIIAVTDAGCIIDKFWLEEITRPFREKPDTAIVSGWYEPAVKTLFQKCAAMTIFPKLKKILKNPNNFLPSSRSVAFKKSAWKKVGGYPETYYTGEDTLFDIKLKKKFGNFHFAPKAIVYWQVRDNLKDYIKLSHRYGLGSGFEQITASTCLNALTRLLFYTATLNFCACLDLRMLPAGVIILLLSTVFSDRIYAFVLSVIRDFSYVTGYIKGLAGYDLQTKQFIRKI